MIVKLPNVRLSFPALFKPEAFKQGDPLKFKSTFLIPKNSELYEQIEKVILQVAAEKWKGKAASVINSIRGNPNKFCWQDGDGKEYDGYEGMMALSAKSSTRPLVIDRDKSPLAEADGKPYAGCYVHASIEFFAYENSGNGISASLRGVQFYKDGDAFAGGTPASVDEFDDIADGAMADDLV